MNSRNLSITLLLGIGQFTSAAELSVPLDDRLPETVLQGFGSLQTGKSIAGSPLSTAGRVFEKGLGTHAPSAITYQTGGGFQAFTAWVGVDDHLKDRPEGSKASVSFQVMGDGRVLYDSGVMRMGDAVKRVDVPLSGVQELQLLVTDAGDGKDCDHANWADATLVRSESGTATVSSGGGGLVLGIDPNGTLVAGGTLDQPQAWLDSARTRLPGFRESTAAVSNRLPGGGLRIKRALTDGNGRTCEVTETFSPAPGCIRWETEITAEGAPWTAPIQSWIECSRTAEKQIWSAWGSPDQTGTQLAAAQAALVQAGKAAVSSVWNDPLVSTPFVNRSWHYGNVAQNVPSGGDYIALPMLTVLDSSRDAGLSVVLSPDDVLLDVDLAVSRSGQIRFSRGKHRLGEGKTRSFSLYLVPHEASWRGGLRFLTQTFPHYFNPPNAKADQLAGCGAYSAGEEPIDVEKFKRMSFGFNWKLSDDFPYMGMFLPPVSDPAETWERSGDEPSAAYKGPLSSCGKMNDYARTMKQNGFAVLAYFNVTEFGKNMNGRKAVLPGDAPDLWKDPVAFLQTKLPNAAFDPRIFTCYRARVVDPADPDYLNFLLEQAERHLQMLPDMEGICIDRTDWLRYYNPKADDGVTWLGDKPGRSLFRSWLTLMGKLGSKMHAADKVIFSNMMTMRLELCRELDGIFTEFGNHGNALNASALLGLRKPVVAWTYNQTLQEPDPDSFMQRHLYMGCFPTAPYPHNNHCIEPEPAADQLYQDYGQLLKALKGRKWVLVPRAVETTTLGVKVNLFEVPNGYVIPVTFGGDRTEAVVTPCKLAAAGSLKASALLPGRETPIPLTIDPTDGSIKVPLHRGCAMIQLTHNP
jgi:hypothetical protein